MLSSLIRLSSPHALPSWPTDHRLFCFFATSSDHVVDESLFCRCCGCCCCSCLTKRAFATGSCGSSVRIGGGDNANRAGGFVPDADAADADAAGADAGASNAADPRT